MRSIRAYLLTRLLTGATLVLLGAGATVYLTVARALEAQFDAGLDDRVRALASMLFQVRNEIELTYSEELMPEYTQGEAPDYFELRFQDGRILEHSESLGADEGPEDEVATLALPLPAGRVARHWTAPLPDGREGRFVAQLEQVHHVFPEEGPERPRAEVIQIVIARGREELIASEQAVLWRCALGSLLLIALLAGSTWLAVRRGLEPAGRLAAALSAIDVQALPERLELERLPAELQPIALTTDALIRRIDSALKRERRTTADIAHELRTPISEVLTAAEVALRDPQDSDEAQRALAAVRAVAWRMGRTVSTLLKLARLEMGDEVFERGPVDLGALVADLTHAMSSVARQRGLELDNQVEPGQVVAADPDALRIVLSNLLSNALHYSPRESLVSCRLSREAEGWCCRIENEAANLRRSDLVALEQPFWRGDDARSDPDRCGLGLALSGALAELSGMQLRFQLEGDLFRAALSGRDQVDGQPAAEPKAERATGRRNGSATTARPRAGSG